jgi:hypothetical protein
MLLFKGNRDLLVRMPDTDTDTDRTRGREAAEGREDGVASSQ